MTTTTTTTTAIVPRGSLRTGLALCWALPIVGFVSGFLPTIGVLTTFALSSCAGVHARETVLMPTMLQAWETTLAKHVEVVAAGSAAELAADLRSKSEAMRTALASGDRYMMASTDWPTLRQAALAGIQLRVSSGEIGPGVGLSIVETTNLFDRNFSKLVSR